MAGIRDIYRMTAPLGYDNGGDVDLAKIMADMKASKAPTPTRHPIKKIIEDRSPVDPYSVLTDDEFKRKDPIEMLQAAPGKVKVKDLLTGIFGAKPAGAEEGNLMDSIINLFMMNELTKEGIEWDDDDDLLAKYYDKFGDPFENIKIKKPGLE